MKNYLLLLVTFFCFSITINAQKEKKNKKDLELISVNPDKELVGEYFNRWSIEADFGQSKGSKPYASGYYASSPDKLFGGVAINHVGIGARYMFSPKFGVRTNINIDNLQEQNGSGSLPFQMQHIQMSFEGVTNLTRLFDIQKQAGRFGLLFHFGLQVSQMSPKMNTGTDFNQGRKELNGGIVAGLSPQY